MYYKLCVMGNPIEHSKSPWIHDQFAKQLKLSVSYTKIKPELTTFLETVNQFKKDKGYGFNITLPFKQEAYQLATHLSLRASIAKSVNTIVLKPDGSIFGDNTDGMGLLNDITKNLNFSLSGKTILIIGAGGAVRGILEPLLLQSPAKIVIANRTIEKAEQLASEFSKYGLIAGCGFDGLKGLHVDLIIDGTGFNSHLSFPDSLSISENGLCYDLKYSDKPTQFMLWAKQKGCKHVVDGLGMLVEQAAEAFYLWTNMKPDTRRVIQLAKETFYSHQEIQQIRCKL